MRSSVCTNGCADMVQKGYFLLGRWAGSMCGGRREWVKYVLGRGAVEAAEKSNILGDSVNRVRGELSGGDERGGCAFDEARGA